MESRSAAPEAAKGGGFVRDATPSVHDGTHPDVAQPLPMVEQGLIRTDEECQ